MPNFYGENAYMESTTFYNGENSWDENFNEEPSHTIHSCYEDSFQYYGESQYDMSNHYQESRDMRIMEMCRMISAKLLELDQRMNACQKILDLQNSNMYGNEESKEENVEMEDATQQQVQIFEEHALPYTHLDNLICVHETRNSLKDEEFFSGYSYEKEYMKPEDNSFHLSPSDLILDEQIEIENIKSSKDHAHNEFVDIYRDPFLEQPCIEVKISYKEYIENWAPKHNNEESEEGVLIKLEASFEDPFFITLPLDKFRSFGPYISRSIERISYNLLTLKGITCKKGLNVQRKVHCRLDGRGVKWDLKVD